MTGWNLPPGCNVNDIPGNRDEDLAEEAFAEALEAKVKEAGLKLPEPWFENEEHWRIVCLARDLGFNEGYGIGKDEGILSMQPEEVIDEQ